MQETWVWSLGQEHPLEEGTATHSDILAWEIPWTEELGGLQSMGSQRVRHDWTTKLRHILWLLKVRSMVWQHQHHVGACQKCRFPAPTLGFPGGSAGKESACNMWALGLIPGLGRSSGEGNGYPLQYSGLENSKDCIVHGVTKSQTQLSDFHFHRSLSRPAELESFTHSPH